MQRKWPRCERLHFTMEGGLETSGDPRSQRPGGVIPGDEPKNGSEQEENN